MFPELSLRITSSQLVLNYKCKHPSDALRYAALTFVAKVVSTDISSKNTVPIMSSFKFLLKLTIKFPPITTARKYIVSNHKCKKLHKILYY